MWRRFALATMVIGLVVSLTAGAGTASVRGADNPDRKADKVNITADDSVDGVGAERLNARILEAEKKPLKATGEPIIVAQRVTVGGNYPFQDTADATQAMAKYYNEVLGGVGADYKNGKPGRPIQLEVCTAELAVAPSQACANQLLQKDPVVLLDTLNLLQSIEYPIYIGAGLPVVENTGITPAAMSNATVPVIDAGCLTSAVVPIVHAMKTKKYKKVALINAGNLGSSRACLEAYKDIPAQFPKSEFQAFTYTTTDPDQLAVAQQVMTFDPDAVIVQTSGTNCAQFWTAWDQLGYDGAVYNASSCQSPALFKSSPDLVKGQIFNFKADNAEAPSSYFRDHPFSRLELEMTDEALEAYKPGGAFTANARANGEALMWLAGVMDQMALKGQAINRQSLLTAIAADSYHLPNQPPPNCELKVPGMTSLCNFKNSLWQVKSVDPATGVAKWKLVAKDVDVSEQFRALSGSTASTTTTVAK